LTDRQANVFCLVALEGMTYRQVADQMKLNTSAVSKLLSRARKRLRERLASVEPELGRRD